MHKLSIIIAVYNVEKYLRECVESLICQDYSNIEIILVDDGSTDGSGIICDDYCGKYEFIKVVHQQNSGQAHARNVGIELASGEYFAFIDSDDYVAPNMFSRLISELERTNSDVAICNFMMIDKDHSFACNNYTDDVVIYSDANCIRFYKLALDGASNRVFRSKCIMDNKIRFESKSLIPQEDHYFQIKLFSYIDRVTSVSDALYFYRQRKSSTSKSEQRDEFAEKCVNAIDIISEYLHQHSGRNIESFINYECANMFITSMNHLKQIDKDGINNVISLFREKYPNLWIKNTTLKLMFDKKTNADRYYKLMFLALNMKMYRLVEAGEYYRLKRLKNKKDNTAYYE